jgi:hypothetical protein
MQAAGEDFSKWVWGMAGGKPIQTTGKESPPNRSLEEISKALKKRGFKFVGPVIVYAWMQAVGIVNDHASALLPSHGRSLEASRKAIKTMMESHNHPQKYCLEAAQLRSETETNEPVNH